MAPLLAKLTTLVAGKGAILWTTLGVLALVGAMYMRISWLGSEIEELEGIVEAQKVDMVVARQTNQVNTIAIHELVAKLDRCESENKILEENSQQAVANFQETLKKIRGQVQDETQRVRQALQNQTCAMVAVPSDVERVLRAGAAGQSGDS